MQEEDIQHPLLRPSADDIFDVIRGMYNALAKRAEDMIVKQVAGEVESSLKDYFSQ